MNTIELFLKRLRRDLPAEEYIAWAEEELAKGAEEEEVAILAGLDPVHDRRKVAEYFRRVCRARDYPFFPREAQPVDRALTVKFLQEQGVFDTRQTIKEMAELFIRQWQEHPHHSGLLHPWLAMDDQLDMKEAWKEGLSYKYPLDDLDHAVAREWVLLEKALGSDHHR